MSDYKNQDESFRDTIATVNKDGDRNWVYPKKPKGKKHRARAIVATILLAFLFGGPFITIDGNPAFLFDILNRHFIILGVRFWPQDMYILVLGMLLLVVFIIVFTSLFGRLWCGWACPQTIFMEMVFRKIEYWIEGDYQQQKKLDKSPLNKEKILKKGSKHIIFYMISFLIANTFLAYIIGKDELFTIMSDPIETHLSGFAIIQLFTVTFYGVFAKFREQACVIVCPYGRYQSVLVNNDSIAVTYDFDRGEPRGKMKKNDPEASSKGDCIDCNQCVNVCPTGIDIRNGIQLECVNCTACMDACDEVMIKIKREPKLIRYATYNNILNKDKFKLNIRNIGYLIVMLVLMTALTIITLSRSDVEALVLRQPGTLFQKISDTEYSNLYTMTLTNKTFVDRKFTLESLDKGQVKFITQSVSIPNQNNLEFRFFVIKNKDDLTPMNNKIQLKLVIDGYDPEILETSFIAPQKF